MDFANTECKGIATLEYANEMNFGASSAIAGCIYPNFDYWKAPEIIASFSLRLG